MTHIVYKLKIDKDFYKSLEKIVDHHIEYLIDLDLYPGTVINATLTSNNTDNTYVTVEFDFEYDNTMPYECDFDDMIDTEGNPEIFEVYSVNIIS